MVKCLHCVILNLIGRVLCSNNHSHFENYCATCWVKDYIHRIRYNTESTITELFNRKTNNQYTVLYVLRK